MKTYPVIIRLADGTEATIVCDTYSPGQTDAVFAAKNDPQAVEIETHRVKGGVDQPMTLWVRETGPQGGHWYGKDLSE